MAAKVGAIGAVLSITLLAVGCANAGDAEKTTRNHAASALSSGFETVFVTETRLLTSRNGYEGLSAQDTSALKVPFGLLLRGLQALNESGFPNILNHCDAVLVGARDFRSPGGSTGLGAVQSHVAYVIVMAEGDDLDISRSAGNSTALSPAGKSIWQWSTPPTEGHPSPYTFYLTQPSPRYILVGDDLGDLQVLVMKLISSTAPLTTGAAGWESLGQPVFWGHRKYRHDAVDKTAAATRDVTPDADMLLFFVEPQRRVGTLRLYSPSATTVETWNSHNLLPRFRRADSRVWETTIPLSGDETAAERLFVVMSMFGFGVYL